MIKNLTAQKFFLLVSIILIAACVQKKTSVEKVNPKRVPSLTYLTVTRQNVKTFIPDLCDSFAIEFKGLYAAVDSLPLLTNDSVYLDKVLVESGFTVMNSGGGNWQGGPRFIEVDLTRGQCHCSVYKKYYSEKDNSTLTISERLICNTDAIDAVQIH